MKCLDLKPRSDLGMHSIIIPIIYNFFMFVHMWVPSAIHWLCLFMLDICEA